MTEKKSRLALLHEIDGLGDDHLVSTHHAAAYLDVSVDVLANWRSRADRGPVFVRQGRLIRYRIGALKAWIASHTNAVAA